MADKKYIAATIAVNAEQLATIEEAMTLFKQNIGIKLTRSQVLTWLAYAYVLNQQKGNKS